MSSSFTLPRTNPPVTVTLIQDLSQDQLLSFTVFKTWLNTLQNSLSTQQVPNHPFHASPYKLRRIDIQTVDFFGGSRIGFVKLKAEVSSDDGQKLPGSVFLRGGSVGMMVRTLDKFFGSETDKHVILTVQPRVPAGSLALVELPAGMIDDAGTFAGAAAKEITEETGLEIPSDNLINMTEMALPESNGANTERLQRAMYPSAGGSDEFIPIFLWQKRVPRDTLKEWQGKLTGKQA
ncbi:MAG: hypothetical protein OHK93_003413 [Ramalina farinacea]|uniref:Nudix hydrolase domain-containing protein n=1 Tax=Ramalina farinacea TaxID=258253 RepID=A0AA43QT64_9LECA|nr:hypothetical protein [Ramalina farinacea]